MFLLSSFLLPLQNVEKSFNEPFERRYKKNITKITDVNFRGRISQYYIALFPLSNALVSFILHSHTLHSQTISTGTCMVVVPGK